MAGTKDNGSGRLEEATAMLIQNQASLVAQLRESDRERAELERKRAEYKRLSSECFERIEALLLENNKILRALPEAIGEKIGFKILEQLKEAE